MNRLSAKSIFFYGLFGLPLSVVALPIYIYVPQFYAERFGLSLTLIGAALLVTRVFDAFLDPVIGMWIDRSRNERGFGYFILIALPLLAIGFLSLFNPPALEQSPAFAWFIGTLLMVYTGFSLATIAHQSWGAALTQALHDRSRVTATREACGLVGVLLAAGVAGAYGLSWLGVVFIVTLTIGTIALLKWSPVPVCVPVQQERWTMILIPFHNPRFRWLFAVLLVNGIAAAIPATLFLFFATDRVRLPQYAGLFIMLYFAAAACSMPLWVAVSKRRGEAQTWLIAMLLCAAVFVWAYGLQAGAAFSFGLISILSGITLGADLALPPALLAAVIQRGGHSGQREGAYFGAWSWATKLNLALAAGISLPLLENLGYVPGVVDTNGTHALSVAYALVPCLLKLVAATILWRAPLRNI